MAKIEKRGEFFKVAGKLIYGWALVSEQKNASGEWEPYVDRQNDHIPEDVMVDAAIDFAKNSRIGKDMHAGDRVANVPLVYVMTKTSSALGIETKKTGMLIGWEPDDPSLVEAVARGERTGFSIGGFVHESDSSIGKVAKSDAGTDGDKPPRVFRRFEISEISLVDVPAMEGATIGYFKNADGTARRVIAKRVASVIDALATSAELRKSLPIVVHIAPNSDEEALEKHVRQVLARNRELIKTGKSTHRKRASSVAVMAEQKKRVIKDVEGVREAIESAIEQVDNEEVVAELKTALDELGDVTDETTESEPDVEKRRKEPPMIVVLTEAQHAHYSKLHGADAAAFLAKSDAARTAIVKAAQASDAVIYKCDDGTEIRKSQGEALAAMAKRADEANQIAKAEREARYQIELQKRASETIGKLKGSDAAKIALLKAAESIEDEAIRTEAIESLRAADALMGEKERPAGVSGSSDPTLANIDAQLDVLAKAYATEHKVPFHKAYVDVINTPEGRALYAKRPVLKLA